MAEAPAARHVTAIEDSRRWRHVTRRAGDIIISTPPKSGTTWMQGIVRSLLWPQGPPPDGQGTSPWVDMRATPIEQLVDSIEAQQHRRFLKTHSPGDCLPFDPRCRYILVYRDPRDALASWANHRADMRPEILEGLNALAAKDGIAPIEPVWNGNLHDLYDEWSETTSPVRHLVGWWPRRHAENLLFVHYADLMHDLEAEMKRIASFLNLAIDAESWPALAQRCGLDSMRAKADGAGRMDYTFARGASSFFYKGGIGRWRNVLPPAVAARCESLVADGLPGDAAEWLISGSTEVGRSPSEMGEPPGEIVTGNAHPLARLRRVQSSAVQEISERRMQEARDQGLFDDLPLAGTPIPDIDSQRKPGWWAARFVRSERAKVRAFELEAEVRAAMPALWRLDAEDQVRERLAELNGRVDRHNAQASDAQVRRLDEAATLSTWRRLRTS